MANNNTLNLQIKATDSTSSVLEKINNSVNKISNTLEKANIGSNFTSATNAVNNLNTSTSKTPGLFSKIGSAASSALAIIGGFKIVNTIFNQISGSVSDALSRLDTMENFSRKIELLTGSAENAEYALNAMKTATKGTAYGLDTAAKAVQNFITRGMDTKDAVKSTEIWMDAVAVYGKGTNAEFESAMDAIAKMRTKGTVEMKQLNRLFQIGINPVRMYAQAVGMAEGDVQTALTKKTISSEEFLTVVEKAMREGTNGVIQVEGMAKKVATTWEAVLNNMHFAIVRGVGSLIEGLDEFFKIFNENGLKGIFKGFGDGMETVLSGVSNKLKEASVNFVKFRKEFYSTNSNSIKLHVSNMNEVKQEIRSNFADMTSGIKLELTSNTSRQVLDDILLKFYTLEETWAKVVAAFTQGMARISKPLTEFAVKYLGMAVTGSEDLLTSFGNWLTLKMPAFFDRVAQVLQWFIENSELVKNTASILLKTFIAYKALDTVNSSINNFSLSIGKLSKNIRTLTGGKLDLGKLTSFGKRKSENITSGIASFAKDTWTHGITKSKDSLLELNNGLKVTGNKIKDFSVNAAKSTGTFFKSFGGGLKSFGLGVGEVVSAVGGSWVEVGRDIKNAPVTQKTAEGLKSFGSLTKDASKAVGQSWIDVFKSPIFQKTGEGLKSFGSLSKDASKAVGKSWLDIFKTPMFQKTGDGLKSFGSLSVDAAKAVGGSWIDIFAPMGKGIGKAFSDVGTDVANAFTKSKEVIAGVSSKLFGFLGGIAKSMLGFITTVISPFISVLSGIASAVLGLVPIITIGVGGIGLLVGGLGLLNPDNTLSNKVTEFFNGLGEKILQFGDFGGTITQKINEFLAKLTESLPKLVTQGVNLLLAFVNGIFINLPLLVGTGFKLVLEVIAGIIQALPAIVKGGFQAIIEFIKGFLAPENMTRIALSVWTMIKIMFNAIITYLPQMIMGGIELVGAIIEGILSLIIEVGKSLLDLFFGAWNYVIDHWDEIKAKAWEFCLNIGYAIRDGFWKAVDVVGDWLGKLFGISKAEAADVAENATYITNEVGDTLENGATEATTRFTNSGILGLNLGLAQLQGKLGSNPVQTEGVIDDTGVSNDIQEIINQAGGAGYSVDEALANGVNLGSDLVSQSTSGLINDMTSEINSTSQEAVNSGASYINSFILGMESKYEDVYMSLSGLTSNCITVMSAGLTTFDEGIPTAIASAITYMTEQVMEDVLAMCSRINTELDGLNNYTVYNAESLSLSMTSIYSKMMSNLKSEILAGKSPIKKKIEEIRDVILDTMNPLKAKFNTLGNDMMTELQKGIDGKKQSIVNTTNDLVLQLKKTFEEGLGIHSPSRYMVWVGQMMAAGLINGLTSSQIQSFIESTISDMQNSFANGNFDATQTVDFLGEKTLDLIGRVNGVDTSGLSADVIAYPLIGTLGTQTSWFGYRSAASTNGIGTTNHGGVDLAAPTGTPIAAALGGTVIQAGWNGGYGNSVIVDHGGGVTTLYGHMSSVGASVGSVVTKGQNIGLVGSTGNSTGPHLHFEVRKDGTKVDPQPYLEGAGLVSGNTLAGVLQQAYNAKHGIVSSGNVGYDIGAGAEQWRGVVQQALTMLGQPLSYTDGVLYAIQSESSGNPNAINNWDSNAMRGDPSRGLLQTIGSTFNAYRNPSLSSNIYDPLANVYAALNYMIKAKGGIGKVIGDRAGGWYGYEVGTRYVPSDMLAMIHKGEAIIPASQNPYSQSGGDYLSDMFSGIISEDSFGMDISGLKSSLGSSSSSDTYTTNNNNVNPTFNITIEKDADGDKFLNDLEGLLHNMLQSGRQVGISR